jgi:hypothetical protein
MVAGNDPLTAIGFTAIGRSPQCEIIRAFADLAAHAYPSHSDLKRVGGPVNAG